MATGTCNGVSQPITIPCYCVLSSTTLTLAQLASVANVTETEASTLIANNQLVQWLW